MGAVGCFGVGGGSLRRAWGVTPVWMGGGGCINPRKTLATFKGWTLILIDKYKQATKSYRLFLQQQLLSLVDEVKCLKR